jgi:hypothetical protein
MENVMATAMKHTAPTPAIRKGWIVVILGLITASAPFATDMYLSRIPAIAKSFETLGLIFCCMLLATGVQYAGRFQKNLVGGHEPSPLESVYRERLYEESILHLT